MAMRPVGPGARLVLDELGDALAQGHGGDHELAVAGVAAVAGEEVEEVADVGAEIGVGREQTEVLVLPGRAGVVVAGADVAVAPDPVLLAPHHQRRLGVGLQAHEPVHDVHARLFEGSGPRDVGLLVEAGLELHHHRHLLARFDRLDERGRDGAVPRGPVQRLLDRQHVGVGGGLGDEQLDRRGEGVVGVMHEDVAFAQHGEEVGGLVAGVGEPRRGHGRPRLLVEVGAVELVDAPQRPEVEGGGDGVAVVGPEVELVDQHVAHVVGDVGGDLEADGPPETAAAQLHLDRGQQVVGLVLVEHEVGVARHPEGVVLPDHHVGEQRRQLGGDDLLQRHEALAVGHDDEARQQRAGP